MKPKRLYTMYTELEIKMLENIAKNDYNNGAPGQMCPIWANCLDCGPNSFSKSQIPGIVSSLSKKGLIYCSGYGSEAMVAMTDKGIAAYYDLFPET